jgi:50S ribosomal subunit-associated GTPase HflX
MVFNKIDRVSTEEVENITARYDAVALSAVNPDTLTPLLEAIEYHIWESQLIYD